MQAKIDIDEKVCERKRFRVFPIMYHISENRIVKKRVV